MFLLIRKFLFDLGLQLLAALALRQKLRNVLALFLFGLVLADSTADDVGAAVDRLVAVAGVFLQVLFFLNSGELVEVGLLLRRCLSEEVGINLASTTCFRNRMKAFRGRGMWSAFCYIHGWSSSCRLYHSPLRAAIPKNCWPRKLEHEAQEQEPDEQSEE
ncbi:hypothetical protein L202_01676 [Cryptococcus amylolentus CBS 6039]|uniref:Uncharacterized protein n=1 Tax=Cryptococcus amylolentus CBS 6039 TaxID=1295533 RepID=A0A1E3I5C8_9TREE|nr:hypothetical protein L202_01676 [Cryptococcus amylolentus CBS 6039]ODN83555.1 hypothetical protein L202_01676 [Cryptococcus amylolentus CBS 6039]